MTGENESDIGLLNIRLQEFLANRLVFSISRLYLNYLPLSLFPAGSPVYRDGVKESLKCRQNGVPETID